MSGRRTFCHNGERISSGSRRARILSQITKYASEAAQIVGSDPIVWLMEPDYYQYAQPGLRKKTPSGLRRGEGRAA